MKVQRFVPSTIFCAIIVVSVVASSFSQVFTRGKTVYNFAGGLNDGADPVSALASDPVGGHLFGTASQGAGTCSGFPCGTVYELTPTTGGWIETVLFSFTGGPEGAEPQSAVTFDALGNLYGTTASGGNAGCYSGAGCGAVFELSPTSSGWQETTLHTFTGGTDGGGPSGSVVFDSAGNLYGTTQWGANSGCAAFIGCGTVYKLTPSGSNWNETTLYSFTGGPDGGAPVSSPIFGSDGSLYGTTANGGNTSCYGSAGCGVVYKLTPNGSSWIESVLYTFTGGADGGNPYAALIFDSAGNLYGTTIVGGNGNGVVFQLVPNGSGGWTENVLYTFTGGSDGGGPWGGLTFDSLGDILGTTYDGAKGYGTVYKLQKVGSGYSEVTLHQFTGTDGGSSHSALLHRADGNYYGTTSTAGTNGFGTVFRLRMP